LNKIIGCIIARTNSKRLPHKVLRRVTRQDTMLDILIKRMKQVSNIDELYITTSNEQSDDILSDYAEYHEIKIYRGSPDNVISRMSSVAQLEQASHVIRITGDNIFTDHKLLQFQIEQHINNGWDYSRAEGLPIGSTAEVISIDTLIDCERRMNPLESEYMMLYLFNPDLYKVGVILLDRQEQLNKFTLTVDTPEDLERSKTILSCFNHELMTTRSIIQYIKEHDVKHSRLGSTSTIKLPGEKTISYDDFRADMDNRLSKSSIINYSEE